MRKLNLVSPLVMAACCLNWPALAQTPNCPHVIQQAAATPMSKDFDLSPHVPSFAVEDALLGKINDTGSHRKAATILYHPDSAQGMFTLQMGSGHAVYTGSDLGKLTQQLNEASKLTPGDTLYVNIDAPANRLEGLNRSLRIQQGRVNANVEVVPLGGDALDMETRDLLFTHPVTDIKASAVYESSANPGWFERVFNFSVRIKNAIKTVSVVVNARTRKILEDISLALQSAFIRQSDSKVQSVTELVSAARYRVKRQQGHVDQVDYLFAAQIGNSFMVSLPVQQEPRG